MRSGRTQAVVAGASMAGMLAARVLAHIFERVIILERDGLPERPELRPGVPQGLHLHILLPRGRRILEKNFPGITAELRAAGAEVLDLAKDVAWLTLKGWGVRFASEFGTVASTRALLDYVVRVRLKQVSNIEIVQKYDVIGFAGPHDRTHCENAPSPLQRVRRAHVGYSSLMFRSPARLAETWRALYIQAALPGHKRAGALFPVEGNRWLVTLQGGNRDYPPLENAGFFEFSRSLRDPALYEALNDAEPLGPITCYRSTENRLFHYERLEPWPESLFVVGDTVCAFNPVYAQGMTTAALAAEDLGRCLRRHGERFDGIGHKFQQRLAKINRTPSMLSTSEDHRHLGTEGNPASKSIKQMHRYMDYVLRSATQSVSVRKKFPEIQGILRGPGTLFHPSVVMRVAQQALISNV